MAERSADDIQRDIERSRAELADAVDKLAYRASPKRAVDNAKQSLRARAQTPQGQAVIAAVGGLLVVVVVKRIRNGRATNAAKRATTTKHTATKHTPAKNKSNAKKKRR